MENKEIKVTRGELYMADLPEETVGSVQAGKRPVLVTQSNWLNEKSPTFLAAIVTSKLKKTRMDTHVVLPQIPGLPKRSMVEAEQRYAVDKAQIIRYIDKLDDSVMKEVTKDKLDDSVMKEVTKALHRSEESDEVTEHRRHSHYRRKKKEAAVAEKKIRREQDGKIDVCHAGDDREGFRGLPNESVRDHSGLESGTEGEGVPDRAGKSE